MKDEKNPIISIITPYYNAQNYIEETAKSILNQTFKQFEWIIVDDGSTDSTGKIADFVDMLHQLSPLFRGFHSI